jgi:YgiT-type zinc finger domain-containing protein
MSTENLTPETTAPAACPHCQAGNLNLKRVVYARWYGAQFVTIPNFPAWVCDVCGSLEYDGAALEQVRLVLGREAGAGAEGSRRASASPSPAPAPARSTGRRPI